jgi:hypothetical protein
VKTDNVADAPVLERDLQVEDGKLNFTARGLKGAE